MKNRTLNERFSTRTIAPFSALFALAVAFSAIAASVPVPSFPVPSWEGRETSVDVPLTNAASLFPGREYRVLRIELAFFAATNTFAQMALGTDRDAPTDALSLAEADLTVGWDCGMWMLRPRGMRAIYTAAPYRGLIPCRRVLKAEFRVRPDGTAGSVSFFDGLRAVTFADAPSVPVP